MLTLSPRVPVALMGLLKWRDNLDGLKDHLCAFMKVDGEEIVKVGQGSWQDQGSE